MYNMPIVKPRPGPIERLTGGFTQGLGLANALQQMAQKRRQQQMAEQLQPLKMQQIEAQTKKSQLESQYMPDKIGIAKMNALSKEKTTTGDYQLLQYFRTLPEDEKRQWITNHPGELDSAMDRIRGATPQKLSQEQLEQQQYNNKIALNQKRSDPETYKRFSAAVSMMPLISSPRMDDVVKRAVKYAGAKGSLKGFFDAMKNTNPQDYNSYLEFENILNQNYANAISKMEGLSVRKEQMDELKGMMDSSIKDWKSNPERALEQYNRLRKEISIIGKGLSKTAQPIYPGVMEKRSGINFDVQDLTLDPTQQEESEKSESSLSQLPTMPTFNTRADFDKWRSTLPENVKRAYAAKAGRR